MWRNGGAKDQRRKSRSYGNGRVRREQVWISHLYNRCLNANVQFIDTDRKDLVTASRAKSCVFSVLLPRSTRPGLQ